MKRSILLLTFAFLLTSCMPSHMTTSSSPILNYQKGANPDLNTVSTTDVGSPIYSEFDYKVTPAIKLRENLKTMKKDIPSSEKLSAVMLKRDTAYVYHDLDGGPYGEIYYLKDQNSNDKIDTYKTFSSNWKKVTPEISYRKVEPIISSESGYRLELVYQGTSKNTMQVMYREYKDSYARPAFTQEVEYDLKSDTTTISFKGSKIKVFKATNNEIKYEVLKGFN